MSKSAIFGFKIASEAMQIKIPGAVLSVGVVWTRDYVRLKALMLENILNTHIMDVRPIENFLQAPEPQGVTVFADMGPKTVTPRGSGACKKFSIGLASMMWVFKIFSNIRAFKRT